LYILWSFCVQIHYNNVWILIENKLREISYENKRGEVVGIFNLSIMFPTILISLFAGFFILYYNGQVMNSLLTWAVICIIGHIIVIILILLYK
jgi:hypothetical protein